MLQTDRLFIVANKARWVLPADTTTLTSVGLGELCEHITANIDTLLFTSLDGGSGAASRNNSTLNGLAPQCYVVPCDEIVLVGRCKDHSVLSSDHGRQQRTTEDQSAAGAEAVSAGWNRFVCIKHFMSHRTVRSDNDDGEDSDGDDAGHHSLPYTMLLGTDNIVDSKSLISTMSRPGMSQLQIAVDRLKQRGVSVVFCCDKIDDEALFITSSSGIYVVRTESFSMLDTFQCVVLI